MSVELRPKGAQCSHDHQRQDDRCEHDVGDKDCEVYATNRTCPGKRPRTSVQVVDDVTRQERGRADERGDHAALVSGLVASPNQDVTDDEKNRRGAVDERVEMGEEANGQCSMLNAQCAMPNSNTALG